MQLTTVSTTPGGLNLAPDRRLLHIRPMTRMPVLVCGWVLLSALFCCISPHREVGGRQTRHTMPEYGKLSFIPDAGQWSEQIQLQLSCSASCLLLSEIIRLPHTNHVPLPARKHVEAEFSNEVDPHFEGSRSEIGRSPQAKG